MTDPIRPGWLQSWQQRPMAELIPEHQHDPTSSEDCCAGFRVDGSSWPNPKPWHELIPRDPR